jgi:hypothetical protein
MRLVLDAEAVNALLDPRHPAERNVRRAMEAGDYGHLRAMRLLPFAAAARIADLLHTIEAQSGP